MAQQEKGTFAVKVRPPRREKAGQGRLWARREQGRAPPTCVGGVDFRPLCSLRRAPGAGPGPTRPRSTCVRSHHIVGYPFVCASMPSTPCNPPGAVRAGCACIGPKRRGRAWRNAPALPVSPPARGPPRGHAHPPPPVARARGGWTSAPPDRLATPGLGLAPTHARKTDREKAAGRPPDRPAAPPSSPWSADPLNLPPPHFSPFPIPSPLPSHRSASPRC